MKTVKQVQVIARYFIKASGSVVYAVRNGENKEYCVTLNSNGTTGCVEKATGLECKGHKYAHRAGHECHHIIACQAKEAGRATAPAETPAIEASKAFVAECKAQREQAAIRSAIVDEEYQQWKRDMGLDLPMTAQEVEEIARHELAYVA